MFSLINKNDKVEVCISNSFGELMEKAQFYAEDENSMNYFNSFFSFQIIDLSSHFYYSDGEEGEEEKEEKLNVIHEFFIDLNSPPPYIPYQ